MMYKTAIGNFEIGAKYQAPISLNASFSTLDKGTAKLKFVLTDSEGQRLPLSAVTPKLAMKMADNSVFVKDNLEITDPVNGVIEYVLSDHEIKHYGEVQAELYLLYNDNRQASVHKFSFRIDRALIDETVDIIQEFYISDFEELKKRLEAKVANIENIETKDDAQARADKAEANAQAYTDVHAKNTELHFNPGERDKWNAGQLFKITSDTGMQKIGLTSGTFYEALKNVGTVTFYGTHAVTDNPSNTSIRGMQLVGQPGSGIGFAVDVGGKSWWFYYNASHTSIYWVPVESTTGAQEKVDDHANNKELHFNPGERDKWNGSQLYKLTKDDGTQNLIPDGTDLLSLPSGFYYGINNRLLNNPNPNDAGWFNYEVIKGPSGRKMIIATASYNNTMWFGTVHTDGVFRGWKRVLTDADLSPAWNTATLINGASQDANYPLKFSVSNNVLWLRGSFGSLPAAGTVVAKFAYTTQQISDFLVPTIGTYGSARFAFTTNGELRFDGFVNVNDESKVTRVSIDKAIALW
ncbi:phage baseplate upper protein [Bacillus sp. FSL M8-0168]|uniref:phage baseplate upper protein n=1 Tax=Bacillus sp. FSL M8-0168 TaxID=2921614 RepID=UPI0030FD334C